MPTDAHVQKVLRSAFAHHTLLAVAHNLDTMLDFDKVVVMDRGRVVESGPPYQLLELEGSLFRGLWKESAGLAAVDDDDVDVDDHLAQAADAARTSSGDGAEPSEGPSSGKKR